MQESYVLNNYVDLVLTCSNNYHGAQNVIK